MKKKIFLLVSLFLIIDIISKKLIMNFYTNKIVVIPNFFSINYVKNTGAAFSILQGKTIILILVALFTIISLIYIIHKNKLNNLECFGYSLFLSGIIGNLIDRIFYGYVIDFLNFYLKGYNFPIFNIADTLIVSGAFILILNILMEANYKKSIDL